MMITTIDCISGMPAGTVPSLQNIAIPYGGFDGDESFWGIGQESESGLQVTHSKALGLPPTLQAVTILSSDVACLPMILERHVDRNAVPDMTLPGGKILRGMANPFMTQSVFRQTLMNHALVDGNGLAYITRDNRGAVTIPNGDPKRAGIVPLIPTSTWLEYDDMGELWYITRLRSADGVKRFKLAPKDVFHIKGLSHDGLWGYSLTDIMRDQIGLGLGMQRHANRVFRNSARPAGVLESPTYLDPEARRNLRREWNEIHQGLDNTARIGVLYAGVQFREISQTNVDAQVVEMLQADAEMQARIFNLPKHMLGIGNPPAKGVEELNLWYLQHSLQPWLCKWCEEARYKLLSRTDYFDEELQFRFDTEAFLESTPSQVYANMAVATGGPFLKRSEARERIPGNLQITREDDEYLSRSTGETATNPRGDGIDRGTNGEEAARADRMRNQLAKLMAQETKKLAKVESEKIRKAASGKIPFEDFLNTFYREWRNRCSEVVSESAADEYCNLRHEELLNGLNRYGNLATLLEKDSEEFGEHGRHLLNLEMNGRYNGQKNASPTE